MRNFNFHTFGIAIKQVRLGQKFSKMKIAPLVLITLVAFVFGVLAATKSCKAPTNKPETTQEP